MREVERITLEDVRVVVERPDVEASCDLARDHRQAECEGDGEHDPSESCRGKRPPDLVLSVRVSTERDAKLSHERSVLQQSCLKPAGSLNFEVLDSRALELQANAEVH